MSGPTIQDLLGDFSMTPTDGKTSLTKGQGQAVTIWLPAEAKARYDKLQEKSGRRFSKKAREVLIELISLAEERLT